MPGLRRLLAGELVKIMPANAHRPLAAAIGPIWREEVHRITCPYCHLGGSPFRVHRAINGPQVQVNTDEVLRCDTCKDRRTGKPCEFKVGTKIQLVGVGLDHGHQRKRIYG